MANREHIPPTEAQTSALRALGLPEALLPAVKSAGDAEAILERFRTPGAMQQFLNGGKAPPKPDNDEGERFLAADATPPQSPEPEGQVPTKPAPESSGEPARGD